MSRSFDESLSKLFALALAGVSWPIRNATILHFTDNCLRQSARHRNRIYASGEAVWRAKSRNKGSNFGILTNRAKHPITYLCVAICTPSCLRDSSQQSFHRNCCSCSRKRCPCCFSFAKILRNCHILRTRTARMTTANQRKSIRIVDFDATISMIIINSPLPTSTPNRHAVHVNLWESLRTTFSPSIDLYLNFGNLCEQASSWCAF